MNNIYIYTVCTREYIDVGNEYVNLYIYIYIYAQGSIQMRGDK